MLYDKSIKNCKGEDKMNTKDYIENKKSKKLSDIFKGLLATGLVVGSMVTSTACKPNQPHESSSSTNTIETTNTTQQTTTETTSTTETTKIDEPIIRTDDQVEKFNKAMQSIIGEGIEPKKQMVRMQKLVSEDNDVTRFKMQICKKIDANMYILREFEISESDYDYIASLYKRVANLTDYDLNGHFGLSSQYLTKNFDDKTLQIITNTILEQEATNQSSEDDLVR